MWRWRGRAGSWFVPAIGAAAVVAAAVVVVVGGVLLMASVRAGGVRLAPASVALPFVEGEPGWDIGPVAWPFTGPGSAHATAVAVDGGMTYVGLADRIVCYETGNPAAPTFVGRTEKLETTIHDVVAQGAYLYAAVEEWTVPPAHTYAGEPVPPSVLSFDVSDPSAPVLVDWISYPSAVYGLAAAGSLLYVATGKDGVSVVSLSDPAHPAIATTLPFRMAIAVAVSGQFLYVSDRGDAESLPQPGGTPTPDITAPANTTGTPPPPQAPSIRIMDTSGWPGGDPEQVGVVPLDFWADCVAADDEYVYFANYWGVNVVDGHDLAHPRLLRNSPIRGDKALEMQLDGDYLYVAEKMVDESGPTTGIEVMDVADPELAGFVAHADMWFGATAIEVGAGYAYAAAGNGLLVYDVSSPADPELIASAQQTRSWMSGVTVRGSYAYVADWYRGLAIYDISNPYEPDLVSVTPLDAPKRVNEVALDVVDDYAYVVGARRLWVFDVSEPTTPELVGSSAQLRVADSGAGDVVVADGRAYITTGVALVLVDVSSPTSPEILSVLRLADNRDVMVEGVYAYVPASEGLFVVDVSSVVSPTEVARIPPKFLNYGARVADVVYSTSLREGVVRFDVSTPANPAYLGSWPGVTECNGIGVGGGLLYFLTEGRGVRIVDPTGPAGMTEVGTIDPDGYGFGIGFSGDFAFVVRGDGYEVVDVSDPESPNVVYSADAPG